MSSILHSAFKSTCIPTFRNPAPTQCLSADCTAAVLAPPGEPTALGPSAVVGSQLPAWSVAKCIALAKCSCTLRVRLPGVHPASKSMFRPSIPMLNPQTSLPPPAQAT